MHFLAGCERPGCVGRLASGAVFGGGDLHLEDLSLPVGIDRRGDRDMDVDRAPALADLLSEDLSYTKARSSASKGRVRKASTYSSGIGHGRDLAFGDTADPQAA